MPRLVKHLAPIAALTLATLGTAWLFSGQPRASARLSNSTSSTNPKSNSEKSGRAPASSSANSRHSSAIDLRYQPKEGHRYTYSFQRRITIQGLPKKGTSPAEIAFHGQLELDVIKSGSESFEALVRTHLVEHEVKNPVTLKIRLNTAGDHLEIFSADIGKSAQNENERQQSAILKDLLSLWVFKLSEDTVGVFDARFEAEPFRKTKLSYIESKTLIAPFPEIIDSEHFLGWDEYRALPHELSGYETTRMGHAQTEITAHSEYQLLLVQEGSFPSQASSLALLLNTSETLALSASLGASDASDRDWSSLRSELSSLDSLDSEAQLKVFGSLVQFVKDHAGSVSDLVDLLRSQDAIQLGVQSALFKTALGALISSGTAEGQRAALMIYSDPSCPVSGKGAILSALTTTQAPLTPATQEFLASTMKTEPNADLAQGASYALGSSLQKAPDDAQKADLVEALRQRLIGSGTSLADQLSALDAIGNSGQTDYLPDLRSIISDSNAASALRAKAVFALRFIHSNEATTLLSQSLSASDLIIRQAAARAMSMASWSESFRKPLQNCSTSDPIASIQAICRSVINNADPKFASN